MEKLTLLMFSKNDIKNALGLIQHLYKTVDEIVLIDSSNKENRKLLASTKKRMKLSKLKIFTTVAIGYPDPLRMYGLSKCRNRWVTLLDTDERLSPKLKSNVIKIINETKADAFVLKRFEKAKVQRKFFTWQVRLFKKDKVTFKGIRHEHADVKGKIHRLDEPGYFIDHHEEVSIHTGSGPQGSGMLDVYEERLTYEMYNKRFMEYMNKLWRPNKKIEETFVGKYSKRMLLLYQKLGFKRSDQEISNFDYFVFMVLKDLGYTMKGRNIQDSPISKFKERLNDYRKMKAWKNAPDSEEALGISKIINTVGITKFLKLDEEKTIRQLNKKYKDKYEGIKLLMKLLSEEYRKQDKGKK